MACQLSTCFQPAYSPTKQRFTLFCVKPYYYYYWVLKCRAIMTNLCSEQCWKKQCVQCHHGCTSSPHAGQTAAVRKGRVDAVLNSSSWLSVSSSTTPKPCLHPVHQVILLITPVTKHIKINKQQIFIIKARKGRGQVKININNTVTRKVHMLGQIAFRTEEYNPAKEMKTKQQQHQMGWGLHLKSHSFYKFRSLVGHILFSQFICMTKTFIYFFIILLQ